MYCITACGTTHTVLWCDSAGSRCTVSGLGANTRHCSTATVFGGASTLFNNGLFFCVTELSGSSKFGKPACRVVTHTSCFKSYP